MESEKMLREARDARFRSQPTPRPGTTQTPLPHPDADELPTVSTKVQSQRTKQAVVALSYMGCAILLIVFNKNALSGYKFAFPNVITMLQLLTSCMFLAVMRSLRLLSFHDVKAAEDEGGFAAAAAPRGASFVPLGKIATTAPLSLAYLVYMLLGMASISGVNLAMYTTLRRTTPAFTMTAEFFLAGRRFSGRVMGSVALMVAGAVLAGLHDLSFDAYGYLLVLASNTSTALYLAIISRLAKTAGLNSFGLMWCNGIVCVPCLLVMTIATGELQDVMQFEHLFSPGFVVTMMGSCGLAFLLNYAIFLNTAVNSAVTQTVCGNLKDFAVIAVGFFAFGGVPFHPLNFAGMALGMAGSVTYAVAKLSEGGAAGKK